jgi:hypothetical protein
MLLELVRAGLASAHAERMVADGKMSEVARVKISDAGWRVKRQQRTAADRGWAHPVVAYYAYCLAQ